MKIAASDVAFSSSHYAKEQHARRESLVEGVAQNGVWNPDGLTDGRALTREEEQAATFEQGTSLLDRYRAGSSLEELARQGQVKARTFAPSGSLADISLLVDSVTGLTDSLLQAVDPLPLVEERAPLDAPVGSRERLKIDLLVATIEQLSGRKFELFEPSELELSDPATAPSAVPIDTPQAPAPEQQQDRPVWGLHYQYRETHYEAETTTFHADAAVQTQDGRQIDVGVDLTMSRQFASEKSIDLRLGGALQDPLVVNFEGTAAELSETKFSFDLDLDGQEDQVRFVGPNSGFLALDENGNGRIDDGGELFGPTTGDGFAELAAHDEDGNQWIDENDSIYSRLRVWTRDQLGNDRLFALGQRDIGAIYLGHAATPFSVKDDENQLQAAVRSSGIYLNEDGSAGTVQQLDLVI